MRAFTPPLQAGHDSHAVLEQHLSYNVSHITGAQQPNSLYCHRVSSSLCVAVLVLSECRGAFWTVPEKSARRQNGCRASLRGDVSLGFDSMPSAGYAARVCTATARCRAHLTRPPEPGREDGGSPWDRSSSIICYMSPRTVAFCGSSSI